jgi:hypothetical protein
VLKLGWLISAASLHERQIDQIRESIPAFVPGASHLVFRCRSYEQDFLYCQELASLQQTVAVEIPGLLTDIICAFSRSAINPTHTFNIGSGKKEISSAYQCDCSFEWMPTIW